MQGNLLSTLKSIGVLRSEMKRVFIDLGTGTGKLIKMVAPYASIIIASDTSSHMLSMFLTYCFIIMFLPFFFLGHAIASSSLSLSSPHTQVMFCLADNKNLPFRNGSADVVFSGWSLHEIISSLYLSPDEWRKQVLFSLEKMKSLLRIGNCYVFLSYL